MVSVLNKVLRADAAGPAAQKLYDRTHILLAGNIARCTLNVWVPAALVPAAALTSEGSLPRAAVDLGLAIALPLHSHVAINGVISDYVPTSVRGLTRWGALGATSIAFLGLLKLNVAGPGITASVKQLWKKPEKQ